jgi:hypothetical protein
LIVDDYLPISMNMKTFDVKLPKRMMTKEAKYDLVNYRMKM